MPPEIWQAVHTVNPFGHALAIKSSRAAQVADIAPELDDELLELDEEELDEEEFDDEFEEELDDDELDDVELDELDDDELEEELEDEELDDDELDEDDPVGPGALGDFDPPPPPQLAKVNTPKKKPARKQLVNWLNRQNSRNTTQLLRTSSPVQHDQCQTKNSLT